ncbi:MAG: hypothetical protein IPO65_11535 [Saprospiraceae bacterium]|nr:hypothetical protein [Saprospiraceae bacterium]
MTEIGLTETNSIALPFASLMVPDICWPKRDEIENKKQKINNGFIKVICEGKDDANSHPVAAHFCFFD